MRPTVTASERSAPSPEPAGAAEVLATVFDLRRSDVEVYAALVRTERATTTDLQPVIDLDRSNVNRSLLTLRSLGLVERRPRLLETGGQQYHYSAVQPGEARRMLRRGVDEWAAAARESLAAFPDAGPEEATGHGRGEGPGTDDA